MATRAADGGQGVACRPSAEQQVRSRKTCIPSLHASQRGLLLWSCSGDRPRSISAPGETCTSFLSRSDGATTSGGAGSPVGAPFNPKQTPTTATAAASEPAAASSSGSTGGASSSGAGNAGGATSSGAGNVGGTTSSGGGATSRLFENVKPPEGMAGAAGSAAGLAEAEALPGRGAGWGAWLGNTIFFSGVAASAFFGYYTYRYSSDQLDTMIQETEKSENAFPGSEVRHVY